MVRGFGSDHDPTTISEQNGIFCNLLADEYHFVLVYNLYKY